MYAYASPQICSHKPRSDDTQSIKYTVSRYGFEMLFPIKRNQDFLYFWLITGLGQGKEKEVQNVLLNQKAKKCSKVNGTYQKKIGISLTRLPLGKYKEMGTLT